MLLSMSWRVLVVSIRSWMEMSVVVRGMVIERLPEGFPGADSW
jgi:hypothetical protein